MVLIIAYLYYKGEVNNKKEALYLQMQNYSLTLAGDKFQLDIASHNKKYKNYTLYEEENLFAFFPIDGVTNTFLKVIFDRVSYDKEIHEIYRSIRFDVFLSFVSLILISFLFSLYTLKPLRQSVNFLEEFLKDMIHDLNTPVTAILLNSRLLKKNYKLERVERIELSAKTIGSLHANLETLIRDVPLIMNTFNLTDLVSQRTEYFKSIYKDLTFTVQLDEVECLSNEDAFQRILDNIISNACKYNKPKGNVEIILEKHLLVIKDTGIGIKDSKRIFERYYKEGERGLGIGLHIVKKLCDAMDIEMKVDSSPEGSSFMLFLKQR